MDQEKIFLDILNAYYSKAPELLEGISKTHDCSLEYCQKEWNKISLVSEKFQSFEERAPSQLSLNKIIAYADEQALKFQRKGLWYYIFRPAYGVSMLLVVALSVLLWTQMSDQNNMVHQKVAELDQTSTPVAIHPTVESQSPIQKRLLTTPFDSSTPYLNRNVSNVSLASMPQTSFMIDEDLERRMISKMLNNHDLETLYFRARKLEKLGYFQDAVHDYLVISNNYPMFEYSGTLPLAIARCYEKMGNKPQAIQILEDYQKINGKSEDTQLWIDLLKSETL